ncbi:hypothetical protein C1708_08320 [Streptomyces sp. DH-12]|nr:hypothetical protein C1708_08320 [Streptomyces sp. DH-12]
MLRLVEPGQYVSIRCGERLIEAGATASVGSVADSYDNAMAGALARHRPGRTCRRPMGRLVQHRTPALRPRLPAARRIRGPAPPIPGIRLTRAIRS